MQPILFLNFKLFEEGTGSKAVSLAKLCERAASETNSKIVLVVQPTELSLIASKTRLDVFSQHLDGIDFGSGVGKILPEAVKRAGAKGAIVNHAAFKVSNEHVQKAVARAKQVGLKLMVCAETTERAVEVAVFGPDFIAIEPPELIGGTVSVSTAKPQIISEAVKAIQKVDKKIKVITGAGIKTTDDVRKAIELGTAGVFVSSGIVKAKNQKKALKEILAGFK